MTSVVDVVLGVHRSLDHARIPHAFGGAIVLAYATEEARATIDVDVNVFVDADEAARVFDALPNGVRWTSDDVATVVRDGQARVHWDEVPLDLFLDYHPFHAEAAATVVGVPFAAETIPVLSAEVLAVFKAFFDRTKDWADIEAMVAASSLDTALVRDRLVELLGADDARVGRLERLFDDSGFRDDRR